MRFKFITGGAGTGKSHTLRAMIKADTDKHVVCAPTGIAALNCGGSTVHSAFRIDPSTGFVSPRVQYGPLRRSKRLYLDEISMVSAELMQSILHACDLLGIEEIIGFGDLAQLKPVRGGWFFEALQPDEVEKLTKNYRQGSDLDFAMILNDIRAGLHTPAHINYVNSHKSGQGGTVLAFRNEDVNRINDIRLGEIQAEEQRYVANISGSIRPEDVPAPMELKLKEGAEVIMLTNDMSRRWRNGTRGIVTCCTAAQGEGDNLVPAQIGVRISDEIHTVDPHRFEKRVPEVLDDAKREELEEISKRETFDPIEEHAKAQAAHFLQLGYWMKPVGVFEQYPIKLGYASTVHKSQGLTLEKANVMPDGFSSAHGLGYVALSRLTSLGGLSASRPFRISDFYCNPKVLPYL